MIRNEEYSLLKNAMGNLTPSTVTIQMFMRNNPGYAWDSYPIDPSIFPEYPLIRSRIEYQTTVVGEAQRAISITEREKREVSFLATGPLHENSLEYGYMRINAGSQMYTAFDTANEIDKEYCYRDLNTAIMLGHTHPRLGPTYRYVSIADILYGITQSAYLRRKFRSTPAHKVTFSMCYMNDRGTMTVVALVYNPLIQQKGGSAIFRLR